MFMLSNRFTRRLVCALGAAALVTPAVVVAAQTVVMPRVRSSHSYIRAMIDEAGRRSDTFRRLVDAIEATDGIVYIEEGVCGHSARACLSLNVTPAAEFRILRILVDPRQPDWEVMASIGHELQHALEVFRETTLKTAEAVYLFYSRENPTGGDSFETSAAIKAGNSVRNEVGLFARRR